ncbi:MAG TPA: hypothetical protein VLE22_20680 [Bryobacteraceae bacterium]|nr:hypothetical protein [Bryobacteraceae bacterium]
MPKKLVRRKPEKQKTKKPRVKRRVPPPETPPDIEAPPVPYQWITATLRTSTGLFCPITSSPLLRRRAMEFAYSVRNRAHWAEVESAREQLKQRGSQVLKEFGLSDTDLRQIAEAGIVEVKIPYPAESIGWEVRILPWEYLLSAATKPFRGDRALHVVRYLERTTAAGPAAKTPASLLFVETAPGPLSEDYSFEFERKLVEANLELDADHLINPTLDALKNRIGHPTPDVIHLTGFDTHQGVDLLDWHLKQPKDGWKDGMFFRGPDGLPQIVEAIPMSEAFEAVKDHPPALVAFNCYNSASRLAALAVGAGAGAAIGFQDDIDDFLAELFYTNFYRAWKLSGWNILQAFKWARNSLRGQSSKLRGTGVILWSATPLLGLEEAPDELEKRFRDDHRRAVQVPPPAQGGVREIVTVEVEPLDKLNYSLLHNDRPLFDTFQIRKYPPGRLSGVSVEVMLHAGPESLRYQSSFDLEDPIKDLKDLVKVPLTSELARSIRESVQTCVFVNVSCGGQDVFRDTYPVTLLPIDEWQDDDLNRVWLPSFVMPRDPVVARIIDAGQRYLMSLADDAGAGFDGYQSVDPKSDDPSEGVDLQVRALWSALLNEYRLGYINPPPTFTDSAQRLRTPVDIVESRHGTCIDLALLLASCLEYVDIYPVVFLLEGHAFPGYWRSDSAHEKFWERFYVKTFEQTEEPPDERMVPNAAGAEPWMLGAEGYASVVELVRSGDLVPLESVWLTQQRGFWEAVESGGENLRSKRDFQFMVDVLRARRQKVTPLPVLGIRK